MHANACTTAQLVTLTLSRHTKPQRCRLNALIVAVVRQPTGWENAGERRARKRAARRGPGTERASGNGTQPKASGSTEWGGPTRWRTSGHRGG